MFDKRIKVELRQHHPDELKQKACGKDANLDIRWTPEQNVIYLFSPATGYHDIRLIQDDRFQSLPRNVVLVEQTEHSLRSANNHMLTFADIVDVQSRVSGAANA